MNSLDGLSLSRLFSPDLMLTLKNLLLFRLKRYQNSLILIAASLFLICFRDIRYIFGPRIWAEEGAVFIQSALESDSLASVLSPHLGYFSLFNNIVAEIAAKLFELKYAAHVTTISAVMLQLLTVFVIYYSKGLLIPSSFVAGIIALSPLVLAPPEIWLTTTSAHYWLASGVFFILNARTISGWMLAYLFFGFFTGAGILFYPFFVIRCFFDRSFALAFAIGMGGVAVCVHFYSLVVHLLAGNSTGRMSLGNLPNILGGLKEVVVPFSIRHGIGLPYLLVLLIGIFFYIRSFDSAQRRKTIVFILLPLVFYSFLVVLSSLGMSGGTRHGLPVYVGGLAIIINSLGGIPAKWMKIAMLSSLGIFLSIKLSSFFNTTGFYSDLWPSWKEQVQQRAACEKISILTFPQWQDMSWKVDIPEGKGLPCQKIMG